MKRPKTKWWAILTFKDAVSVCEKVSSWILNDISNNDLMVFANVAVPVGISRGAARMWADKEYAFVSVPAGLQFYTIIWVWLVLFSSLVFPRWQIFLHLVSFTCGWDIYVITCEFCLPHNGSHAQARTMNIWNFRRGNHGNIYGHKKCNLTWLERALKFIENPVVLKHGWAAEIQCSFLHQCHEWLYCPQTSCFSTVRSILRELLSAKTSHPHH